MKTKIGYCKVHESTRELDYYFDKTQTHSWTGPTVKVKSIELYLSADVNAIGYGKDGLGANVNFNINVVITDEKDRSIEKSLSISKLKDRFKENAYLPESYLIGWSEGENKIVLNEIGKALLNKVSVQSAF